MRLERTAQVWGITGNLGGGKTLSAVEIAVTAIQSGYYIVTNINLDVNAVTRYVGFDARQLYSCVDLESSIPDEWPCGSPRGTNGGKRVLVILDEVAEWFDQYSASSPSVRRFLSWLRHSSKRGQDVFLVVQRREYLAKSLRILVSRWIWVDDLAVWRLPKLRIRLPFCGHLCHRSFFDRVGNSIQPGELVSKAKWGRFYDTAQCLSSALGQPVTYSLPVRPVPVARNWSWLASAGLFVVVLLVW